MPDAGWVVVSVSDRRGHRIARRQLRIPNDRTGLRQDGLRRRRCTIEQPSNDVGAPALGHLGKGKTYARPPRSGSGSAPPRPTATCGRPSTCSKCSLRYRGCHRAHRQAPRHRGRGGPSAGPGPRPEILAALRETGVQLRLSCSPTGCGSPRGPSYGQQPCAPVPSPNRSRANGRTGQAEGGPAPAGGRCRARVRRR